MDEARGMAEEGLSVGELGIAVAVAGAFAAIGAAAAQASGEPGLTRTAVTVLFGMGLFALGGWLAWRWLWRRRWLAGAALAGTEARAYYDCLREELAEGGTLAVEYARRLTWGLDRVDRFFGDAGTTRTGVIGRVFGLREPAALWTAVAFDRCLLLAMLYPMVLIVIFWASTGAVGGAEAALGLSDNALVWRRASVVGAMFVSGVALWGGFLVSGLTSALIWLAVAVFVFSDASGPIAFGVTVAIAGSFFVSGAAVVCAVVVLAVVSAFAFIVSEDFVHDILRASSDIFSVVETAPSVVAYGVRFATLLAFAVPFVFPLVFAFLVMMTIELLQRIKRHDRREGIFLVLVSVGLSCVIFLGAVLLPEMRRSWEFAGPLLLLFALFALTNAPFDWLSLGLTRGLLRRGLQAGGWVPLGLLVVDAVLAALFIMALGATLVIAVQAFDGLAVASGKRAVLPLDPLFRTLAEDPWTPSVWWVYGLLLTTLLPSVLNFAVAWLSLLRGVPALNRWMLRQLPADGRVAPRARDVVAVLREVQILAGIGLAVAAQAGLLWLVFGVVLPWWGVTLLDAVTWVADLNLPAPLIRLLFG